MTKSEKNRVLLVVPHGAAFRLAEQCLVQFSYDHLEASDVVLLLDGAFKDRVNLSSVLRGLRVEYINMQDIKSSEVFLKRALSRTRSFLYPIAYKNQTLDDFHRIDICERNSKGKKSSFVAWFERILLYVGKRSRNLRRLFCYVESGLTSTVLIEDILVQRCIDSVLVTAISGIPACEAALVACKRRKLRSSYYLQSWDNLSGNGYRLNEPDMTIVYSDAFAKMASMFQDISPSNISVVSALQYAMVKASTPRTEIPNLPRFLYAGKSTNRFPYNHVFCEFIYHALDRNYPEFQLTIRPHPLSITSKNLARSEYARRDLKAIEKLCQSDGRVVLEKEEQPIIYHTLYPAYIDQLNVYKNYSIVFNVFSTVALEACIVNVPCISLNIEAGAYKYSKSLSRKNLYIDQRQYHNNLLSEAVPVAFSISELEYLIRKIIRNPNELSGERMRIRRELMGLDT